MSHLTCDQRYRIWSLLEQGLSLTKIGESIGKCKSVVSRELRRNCDKRNGKYDPNLAQRKYDKRQKSKKKRCDFTDEIKQQVIDFLKQDYSPEQIVGSLKSLKKAVVSIETIYQFIWQDKKSGGKLFKHLRHCGKKYRKRGAAKDQCH